MDSKIPAHALYGQPVNAIRPSGQTASSRLAFSTAEYERDSKCVGNDNTCLANRAKGTPYCAGHLRSLKSSKLETEESTDAADKDEPF
jgi:hypothetical protein